LLGILDKGTLTLGTNEKVDLTATIIVMTSNVGSKEMARQSEGDDVLGFSAPTAEDVSVKRLQDISKSAAKRKFMPEFLNRLDEIVVFNTLTKDDIKNILKLVVHKFQQQIIKTSKAVVNIDISPAAERKILEDGFDKKYGARFLKREIEKRVIVPIARIISSKQVFDQDTIVVDYDGEFRYYGGLL
jgi:ATP-dependent Clp protease ATP-binding subunit ClpA